MLMTILNKTRDMITRFSIVVFYESIITPSLIEGIFVIFLYSKTRYITAFDSSSRPATRYMLFKIRVFKPTSQVPVNGTRSHTLENVKI